MFNLIQRVTLTTKQNHPSLAPVISASLYIFLRIQIKQSLIYILNKFLVDFFYFFKIKIKTDSPNFATIEKLVL